MIERIRIARHWILGTAEGRLVLAVITTLLTGTLFYARVEGWSIIDALYFSVVTLTTIGYGDLHPTRDISKLFTIGYIFVGLGLIAAFINSVAQRRITRSQSKAEEFASERGTQRTQAAASQQENKD